MDAQRRDPAHPDVNEVLTDITSALVGHFTVNSVLDRVVDTSMRTLHAEVCSIFLEDKQNDPGFLTMMAGSGFAKKLVGKAKYRIGEGFTGMIAQSGGKFNIKSRDELEKLEVDGKTVWRGKFDGQQWPTGQSEFRNCIALSLRIKDQILGVIKVENKDFHYGQHFSEEDVKYFETMANVVALAIENARLHEQIEKQLKTIAAKAAHRIHNQVTNYDGIEVELSEQIDALGSVDKDKLKHVTARIADTTKSLKRMVDEFKSYGKPIAIHKEMADINSIVENEIWLAKPPKEICIKSNLDKAIHAINIDAGRFAEAIKELLRNSIRAVSKTTASGISGEIFVSTCLSQKSPLEEPSRLKSICLKIEDNGPGFPLNFPVFEPFYSTDPQSTGMGLATVKELIEAHEGSIEVGASTTRGALVEIHIPYPY